MDVNTVRQMIVSDISDAVVTVEGEDCSFTVTVVSGQFSGKTPVARQKMVMAPFSSMLATGELHALSVKTLTPDEQHAIAQPQ